MPSTADVTVGGPDGLLTFVNEDGLLRTGGRRPPALYARPLLGMEDAREFMAP